MALTIESRMLRFQRLLDNGGLTFHQYQYEAVLWCLTRELGLGQSNCEEIYGGIVADEMGLGKTIQMIGLMYVNFVNKTLIVVPPILMEQWFKEIYRISGHKAFIYHGKNKQKLDLALALASDKNKNIISEFVNAHIVITSYNTIAISKNNKNENKNNKNNKNNNENVCKLLKIKWDRVIFDEAHHLRNKNTTRFLGSINIRAKYRWLLSGTPIQNKKSDFVHLCYILSPKFYVNQKKSNRDNDTLKEKEKEKEKESQVDSDSDSDSHSDNNKENIITMIQQNHVLKRTKKMVGLEIADLNCSELLVEWKSEDEKQFAQEIHSLIKVSGVSEKHLTCFAKQIGQGFGFVKSSMLMAVLRAKQSCIMPELMKKTVEWLVGSNKINKKYLNVLNNNDFASSKLEKVINIILERKDNKRGKIVFCQFRGEMNYLFDKMIENGLSSMIIDGRCNGKKRLIQLEKSVDVLILQIQTGCEGLNLQEFYSEVYFVSPHWNPSVEDQAVARCHRMGQKQVVEVFKFIMNGFDNWTDTDTDTDTNNNNKKTISLEKHILSIQEFKRGLRLL